MKLRAFLYPFSVASALLFSGLCGPAYAQTSHVDSLKRQLSQKLPDSTRAMVLEQIGRTLMYSEPTVAMKYVREGLTLARKAKYPVGIVRNLNRQGTIYRIVGSYAKAMEAYVEGLRIAQANDDIDGLTRVSNSVGVLYSEQKDYERAIAYFTKTRNLAQQIGDAELLEIALTNLASGYAWLNTLDSAQAFALRAYEMAVRQQDENSTSVLYIIMGNIHYRKKEYPLSLAYFRRSLPLSRAVNDQQNLGQTYFEMARVFRETGAMDSCRIYAEQSLKLAQQVNNPKNILDASTLLTEFYEDKDQGKAYQYFKIATQARDQMFDRDKIKRIQALDFEEQLRTQQIENDKAGYQNRIRTLALLVGLAVVMLIAFLLYRNSRNRRKANVLLQKQKNELQATLTELKTTQAQLIQAEKMASLGELTAGIAHEIQNPLNFVNNYAEVNMELLQELVVEGGKEERVRDERLMQELLGDVEENEKKILHHGRLAEAIVRGMQQHSRRSSGVRELTDVNALVRVYTDLAYNGMTAKDKLAKDVMKLDLADQLAKINIVSGDVGRVILNLLDNAFYAVLKRKESESENYIPTILVATRQLDGVVEIRIKDNGTGISPENIDKLFQPFFTTKPTGQGTGLGLSLAYDIVTKGHNGKLEVMSKKGEGTEFIATLKG